VGTLQWPWGRPSNGLRRRWEAAIHAIEIRYLGPVQVLAGAERLAIGGPRPTSLLIALALTPGDVVSIDRLLEEVWGAAPPPSAVDTLQSYLSRLRHVLEPDLAAHATGRVLVRGAGGYRLDAELIDTDARRFVAEVAAGRRALTAGDLRRGVDLLTQGSARWHGAVAQGVDLGPAGRAEAARLQELRLGATEELLEARLAAGEHAAVIGELEALVHAHPVRERFHGLRMLALYRSGRQGEALAAYREARRQLVEHLGVEPSPPLARLHDRLLAQDPTLLGGASEPLGPMAGGAERPVPEGLAGPEALAREGAQNLRATRDLDGEPAADEVLGPSNLPAPLTALVGREDARREVAAALRRSRAVTLTGAGGCGKTQLALEVGRDVHRSFPGGVWVVDLQALRDEDLVPEIVAETLGLGFGTPDRTVAEALADHLADRCLLLVLDNCEHLVDACAALVHDLLVRCRQLRVLATSRQPLDVEGELTWRVPSLGVPSADGDLDELRASDAARLFERRASEVRPGYRITERDAAAVRTLCRSLDGIPLALELAAARLRVLEAEEVAARLDDRFALLRSSRRQAPSRHRTLEAAIAWSYDLLDDGSRRLLARLSVFEGGFTLDAVEAVGVAGAGEAAALELLEGLLDRSLVVSSPMPVGPARHDLLETIRSFARTRLGAEEAADLAADHACWCADLASTAASELNGAEQVRWLNLLHAEQGNLRAALAWSLRNGRTDLALRIAAGVWWFWSQFGHAREGARWLNAVLDRDPGAAAGGALLQRATFAAGRLHGLLGDHGQAAGHLRRSAELARERGADDRWVLAQARLAQVLDAAGAHAEAARTLAAAREEVGAVDDPWIHASVADVGGHLAWRAGDLTGATAAFRESERNYLEAGDRWSACLARLGSATVARRRGDQRAAMALHGRNLADIRALTRSELDFVGLARDLRGIAVLCSRAGRHEEALELVGASESARTMGELPLTPEERAEVDVVLADAAGALPSATASSAQTRGRRLAAPFALERAGEIVEELQLRGDR
jgi:predicted ATPase/DNA-binding SARP family transcriptional activator